MSYQKNILKNNFEKSCRTGATAFSIRKFKKIKMFLKV